MGKEQEMAGPWGHQGLFTPNTTLLLRAGANRTRPKEMGPSGFEGFLLTQTLTTNDTMALNAGGPLADPILPFGSPLGLGC